MGESTTRALVLVFGVLWLALTAWEVGIRKGLGAKIAAFLSMLWLGGACVGIFGREAEHTAAIVPILVPIGVFGVAVSWAGLRNPANLQRRVSLYFAIGSLAATLGVLAVWPIVGTSIPASAHRARSAVSMLFLDLAVGVPFLFAVLDHFVMPGLVLRVLRRTAKSGASTHAVHASSTSMLPRASLHIVLPGRSERELRAALERVTAPIGSASVETGPRYRGSVPSDGAFALTRYLRIRGRLNPFTFDVETFATDKGAELVMHAREGIVYGLAAFEIAFVLVIALAVTWNGLLAGGEARERALFALEAASAIAVVVAMFFSMLIHAQGKSMLLEDRDFLLRAVRGEVPEGRPSVIAAIARLLLTLVSLFVSLVVVATVLMMIVLGAMHGPRAIVILGLGLAVFYGLIGWAIEHAARHYLHVGWRRDLAALRGR